MDSPCESGVRKRVRDLCVLLHTELYSLVAAIQRDPQDEDSFMSLEEVMALDTLAALDHVEAAVKELLEAKRSVAESSQYSVLQEQEKYGHALQKLETEVRSHIQAEHQMALHIELLQQKLEDEAKDRKLLIASYDSLLEKMQKDYDSVCLKLKESKGETPVQQLVLQRSMSRKGKSINDVQLRKLPSSDLRAKDLEAKLKKALFDHPELEKLSQRLCPEEGKSRQDDRSQLSRMRRDIDEVLKDPRRKSKDRSASPLLATLRRDSTDFRKDKKTTQKGKKQSTLRSASTERLRGNKSSTGLISGTWQQF